MATRSSILVWRIPWAEEPGGLQSTGLQKSRTRLGGQAHTHIHRNSLSVLPVLPTSSHKFDL